MKELIIIFICVTPMLGIFTVALIIDQLVKRIKKYEKTS